MGLNSIDDTEEGFKRFLRRNPHTCFCYEEDGILLGAIMAGNDGRRGFLSEERYREKTGKRSS